jgi:hypothetical protein
MSAWNVTNSGCNTIICTYPYGPCRAAKSSYTSLYVGSKTARLIDSRRALGKQMEKPPFPDRDVVKVLLEIGKADVEVRDSDG